MVHWVLLVLDMGHRTFILYDSLVARTDSSRVQPLVDYLVQWFRRVKDSDISAFPIDVVADRPIQGNNHDCELFVLKEMEYITRDASLDFTQKDIKAMRPSLLSEMLNGVLDFNWSPADPILALFVPEVGGGNQPARVSLVPIPGSLQR
ncbi:putative ubiquitin-like-specific protease 1B [Tasmannia lanceolata]|uniref:putative ubiquitin-like-specific protease 1B n=1 Tax=Tasmannia lanceolata TaxID=3420 RepID=UPI0040645462